jgi:hypothetical protein
MYNSACARCRAARAGGYTTGCAVHRNVAAPTVVVERHHHHHSPTVVVVEERDAAGELFIDSSGEVAMNLGGGIGVELGSGDITVGGWDTGSNRDDSGSCGSDW